MKTRFFAFSLIFTLFCLPALACTQMADSGRMRTEFLAQVNQFRAKHGLGALRLSDALGEAAIFHSCDMASRGVMSHKGSRGSTLKSRLRKVSYRISTATENILRSQRSPSAAVAMKLWVESSGHRANLLNPQITEMGIAAALGTNGFTYFTFVGARPRG